MQSNGRTISLYAQTYGKSQKQAQKTAIEKSITAPPFKNKQDLLMSCFNAWNSLQTLREDIRRNEEFVYGDQHSDKTPVYFKDSAGRLRIKDRITERRAYEQQGLNPPQYNIIRNIIRTVVGNWLNNKTLPVCIAQKDNGQQQSEILTTTLHAVLRKNEYHKFTASQLVQLMISAFAAADVTWANRGGDADVYFDAINIFNIFIDNTMTDNRFKDCALSGYFIDKSIGDVVSMFSDGSPARAAKIRALYSDVQRERTMNWVETFTDKRQEKDFFLQDNESYGLARIFKIWNVEEREGYEIHDRYKGTYYFDIESTEAELIAENERRMAEQSALGIALEDMLLLDYNWNVQNITKLYYLTPYGDVLFEKENPYWHGQPSIVFEIYEFFIGKIYPFIKDCIDAQKQVNQTAAITQLLIKYSAKNLLFMPRQAMGDNPREYYENALTSYNAVVDYEAKESGFPTPNFVSTIQQAFAPLNMITMYLNLAEKVSGVYGALQGQPPTAGTPAMMYAQQSQNSVTSLNGVYDAINGFARRMCKMIVQLIQQYYEDNRYIFDQARGKMQKYTREAVKNIDFEISIAENTNTPAYRLMINETLMNMIQLPFEQMEMALDVGEFPFKEKMQNYIAQMKQQAQQAAQQGQQFTPSAMPEDLQQQMGQYQFTPEVQQELENLPPEVQQYA
ncbi:MAG: hypothetical protein FWF72_01395, partial [Paludibacter sp.]|nr:hypothetical protein [Paludibacter sp.]